MNGFFGEKERIMTKEPYIHLIICLLMEIEEICGRDKSTITERVFRWENMSSTETADSV